jgi:integrase
MPRVFHQTYSAPIPPGAERVTLQGKAGQARPAVRFRGPDGKPIVAPLTRDGTRCLVSSPCWYGWVPDADAPTGRRREKLCTNRTAAEQLLAELVKKAELAKAVIKDPFEEHRHRPLPEHLDEWEAELRTRARGKRRRPPTAKQVAIKVGRARRVLDGCSFRLTGDITLAGVQEFLQGLTMDKPAPLESGKQQFTLAEAARALGIKKASVAPLVARHGLAGEGKGKARRFPRATVEALLAYRSRGLGHGTAGYYAREVKAFTHWLARRRRVAEDPLADLPGATPDQSDHRHDRRTPSEAELRGAIAAAQRSAQSFRGLNGQDRATLYATAAASGFRVDELASLTPEAFDLAGDLPCVTLRGDMAKNGRLAVQPLPPDLAAALRPYLTTRPAGQPVWPGSWYEKGAAMLRRDLEAAGIPYVTEGLEGPLYFDFHALRHGYVALLDKAGASLKEAMILARHSDPKLTMARYGRAQLHDLATAVERLPRLLPDDPAAGRQTLRATGTGGRTTDPASLSCPVLVQAPDSGCIRLRLDERGDPGHGGNAAGPNPMLAQGIEAGCERLIPLESSSGGWDRTSDTRLMKSPADVVASHSPAVISGRFAFHTKGFRRLVVWPLLPAFAVRVG